ncbi:MAG: helix-turn-helix domain-containing protein [Bacteroidota bacterium]
MSKTIILQGTTPEELAQLIQEGVKNQLQEFKRDFKNPTSEDELLTREETCNFLKINSSTLWAWTNKGKVKAYGIANRRYYKRSELLECLIQLKK